MRALTRTFLPTLFVPLAAATVLAQGSLNPPGPPAPSMKSLGQIEPRTPIPALPFTIAEPGSYYLTGPLHSTNSGITVSASDVTIDLMGFTIGGAQNTNHPGIHVAGGNDVMLRNVVIRNGAITRFGTGVLIENTQGGGVRGLTLHQNTAPGIHIRNNAPGLCSDIVVEDCVIDDNGGHGIFLQGANASPQNNRGHTLQRNRISGNVSPGIRAIAAQGCLIEGNLIGPHTPSTNAFAIFSGITKNVVVRNISQGNTNEIGTPFFFVQHADTYGPLVHSSGALYLSSTNENANPWANFSK